jgi:hypothetical protein
MDNLLRSALERFPDILFMSTVELAGALTSTESELVESRPAQRIRVWLARAAQIPRLRKFAWITGAILPASLVHWTIRHASGIAAPGGSPVKGNSG